MKKSGTNNKKKRNSLPGIFSAAASAVAGVSSRIFGGRGIVVGEKMRSDVTAAVVVKYIVYAVASLFLILLRTTFFSRFRPFGASPDILIVAVAAIALYEGGRAGAVFGVAIGFVAEALGGVGIILLPPVYMLVGYLCGTVATDYYRRSWVLFLVFDVCAAAARAFVSLLYVMMTWHTFDLSAVLTSVILPEFLSTLALSPLPALMLLPIYLIFRKKKKELE